MNEKSWPLNNKNFFYINSINFEHEYKIVEIKMIIFVLNVNNKEIFSVTTLTADTRENINYLW